MKYGRLDTKLGKYLRLLPVLLLVILCASTAFASQIPCAANTLDNFLGNYVVCGTMTFDFTAGFYFAGGGTSLAEADIIVTPYFSGVNFSVTAGAGGAFATTGTGNGYSTFEIGYSASIVSPYFFSGVGTRANNVHFDGDNGGADSADALKIVLFGSNPDDDGNPYAYSVDAAAAVDTSGGGSAVNIPSITDATMFFPQTTTTMFIDDTITLNPTGEPGESIQSVDNIFLTPEPVTLLSLGTALGVLGLLRRRNRT